MARVGNAKKEKPEALRFYLVVELQNANPVQLPSFVVPGSATVYIRHASENNPRELHVAQTREECLNGPDVSIAYQKQIVYPVPNLNRIWIRNFAGGAVYPWRVQISVVG